MVNSIHKTLDQIKTRYNASGFNLIGYSGGGAIAALVAADRNDILSLRTVAGNLDIDVHTDFIDPVELIADRIRYALKFFPPEKLFINPDCGLRTRSRDVGRIKLLNMVRAVKIIRKELGLM